MRHYSYPSLSPSLSPSSILFILIVLITPPLSALTCTSTGSTSWGTSSTWASCGGGIPSATDSVTINNGHVVTSSSGVIIASLTLIGTGTVNVTFGTFQVNGPITFDANAGCSVSNPALTLSAGTNLKFDSIGPASGTACRSIVANGTLGSRVGISARSSTASAHLGGNIIWSYADIANITTFNADEDMTYSHHFIWNVTHSTFNNIGVITGGCCGLTPGVSFTHAWNNHFNSANGEIFTQWYGVDGTSLGSGVRDIYSNVFDVSFSESFPLEYFSFVGNYMGKSAGLRLPGNGNRWNRFEGNLIRDPSTSGPGRMMTSGDIVRSIIFMDQNWENPKPLIINGTMGSMSIRDTVVDHAGNAGTADSGELWWDIDPPSNTTCGIYGTLMLCNMYNTSSYEAGAWGVVPHMIGAMEHSLWCGGYTGSSGSIGFPAVQMGEAYTPLAGQFASLKSNIFWHSPTGPSMQLWSKFMQINNSPTPTQDICAPANCDYNTGYGLGYVSSVPGWSAYTNQGKGYVAKFSSPPGVHDVEVDPMFLDYKRSLPLFYTKYLGNAPAAWSSGTAYTTGAVVSYTDPAIYYGLPVAYRYQNIGSCASTNPQPGSGTNWRDCWEWATLKWIRDNIPINTLFDDPYIGVSQGDAIATVWAWIRAGYSPTNRLLSGTAHDGGDIGPIPVTFPPPGGGTIVGPTTTTHVIRGVRVRGRTIR